MAGKGSAPRPLSVSDEEFGKRFDAIDWSWALGPELHTYHVTYYYLATGMENGPDERDFGLIAAKSEAQAKRRILDRECPPETSDDYLRSFTLSCLSARKVDE